MDACMTIHSTTDALFKFWTMVGQHLIQNKSFLVLWFAVEMYAVLCCRFHLHPCCIVVCFLKFLYGNKTCMIELKALLIYLIYFSFMYWFKSVNIYQQFESLIEREWICAGHPFSLRNAHSAYAEGSITGPHESPVFLCFLDAVHQIIFQYPHSFEFGEDFLIFLFEHAYASEFGSFLGSNEKMKSELNVKKLTVSLWSYINNPTILRSFVNTLYEPRESVLWPSVAPQSIRIWERLFFRWQKDWTEEDSLKKSAAQWMSKERELTSRAVVLRR
uniref:Myotubularin phosphatase domain-containing protein n=1 Tax=Heterorhabditis bacteriophora TaxID=37862 RepID=A0A1I7WYF2_HETBA